MKASRIWEGLLCWLRCWFALLSGDRNIIYGGWIRATSEMKRGLLQARGVSGAMRWTQETPTFGVFEYCLMNRADLWLLHSSRIDGSLDIHIGGFTGLWKGIGTQVPRGLQEFWNDAVFWENADVFSRRHGYTWDQDEGKYIPVVQLGKAAMQCV